MNKEDRVKKSPTKKSSKTTKSASPDYTEGGFRRWVFKGGANAAQIVGFPYHPDMKKILLDPRKVSPQRAYELLKALAEEEENLPPSSQKPPKKSPVSKPQKKPERH